MLTNYISSFSRIPGWDADMYNKARVVFYSHMFGSGGRLPINFQDYMPEVTPEINITLNAMCRANPLIEFGTPIGVLINAPYIHKWFVNNVQSGSDDCKMHMVTPQHLKRLGQLCNLALRYPYMIDALFPDIQQNQIQWRAQSNIENTLRFVEKAQEIDWNTQLITYRATW